MGLRAKATLFRNFKKIPVLRADAAQEQERSPFTGFGPAANGSHGIDSSDANLITLDQPDKTVMQTRRWLLILSGQLHFLHFEPAWSLFLVFPSMHVIDIAIGPFGFSPEKGNYIRCKFGILCWPSSRSSHQVEQQGRSRDKIGDRKRSLMSIPKFHAIRKDCLQRLMVIS